MPACLPPPLRLLRNAVVLATIYFLFSLLRSPSPPATVPLPKAGAEDGPSAAWVLAGVEQHLANLQATEGTVIQNKLTKIPQGRRPCLPAGDGEGGPRVFVLQRGRAEDPEINNLLVSLRTLGWNRTRVVDRAKGSAGEAGPLELADALREVSSDEAVVAVTSANVLFLAPPEALLQHLSSTTAKAVVSPCGGGATCANELPAVIAGSARVVIRHLESFQKANNHSLGDVDNAMFATVSDMDAERTYGGSGLAAITRDRVAICFASLGPRRDRKTLTPLQRLYTSVLPPLRQRNRPKRPRVVISLTTVPPRVLHIRSTLDTLVNQTMKPDMIYLQMPKSSERFKDGYWIPRWLRKLPITVNRCDDRGPATKLLGVLPLESDPDTLIILADDDMIYPPDMVSDLVSRFLGAGSRTAVGYAGQVIEMDNGRLRVQTAQSVYHSSAGVDVLEAFRGVVYRRGWFDASLERIPDECLRTDDIWIAAHLARKGIPRVKLEQPTSVMARVSENDVVEPLREGNVFGQKRNDRCAALLRPDFERWWLEKEVPCPVEFRPL
ncbi:hypothetical protein DFJ74DRAFT_673921 [Hyaloraphidium curvatum]|nr:hypothetical protein DFJ74DRAFT_673921 [Hyaloraphidium curvatum]